MLPRHRYLEVFNRTSNLLASFGLATLRRSMRTVAAPPITFVLGLAPLVARGPKMMFERARIAM